MIATQTRESITLRVFPSVTAKAASVAAEEGISTVEVLERFIERIDRLDLSDLRGPLASEPEKKTA